MLEKPKVTARLAEKEGEFLGIRRISAPRLRVPPPNKTVFREKQSCEHMKFLRPT